MVCGGGNRSELLSHCFYRRVRTQEREDARGDSMQFVVRKIKNWIVAVVVDDINRGGGTGIAIRALLSSEMLRLLSQRGIDRDLR
jgi:hypothetical protein